MGYQEIWSVSKAETAAAITKAMQEGKCSTEEQIKQIAAQYDDKVAWVGFMPKRANHSDNNIDCAVSDMLREIGIPASLMGYRYVREAIKLVVEDTSMLYNMTKGLYPTVAEKFGTTASCVERNIRQGVANAWERCNFDTLLHYFGYTASKRKGMPTNSEFIAILADRILLEVSQ